MLQTYSSQGLTILAFPCNQFLLQEPAATPTELLNGIRYVRPGEDFMPHQDLHIYWKLDVNGINTHPMYTFLKGSCPQAVPQFRPKDWLSYDIIAQSDVFWNFEKFLIDKNGIPRWRFAPSAWGSNGDFVEPYLQMLLKEPASNSSIATSPMPPNNSPKSYISMSLVLATVATGLLRLLF